MSTEHDQIAPADGEPRKGPLPQPHQEQPQSAEGHAGQGSESAMKQMRLWEQRRASNSGGKGRAGPD